jgi:hypothetical protein
MRTTTILTCTILLTAAAHGAPPSFRDTAAPGGWTNLSGRAADGTLLRAGPGAPLLAQTTEPLPLPVEATFRLRLPAGEDGVTIDARAAGAEKAPALLQATVTRGQGNSAGFSALSDGRVLACVLGVHAGLFGEGRLSWRFPSVENLWDERDRLEIGSAFAGLQPFDEKVFVLRLVLTEGSRQVWLDDRLVGEDTGAAPVMEATKQQMLEYAPGRVANPRQARFAIRFAGGAGVLSADFRAPEKTGAYVPLRLDSWSQDRNEPDRSESPPTLAALSGGVPMWMAAANPPAVDLGRSLFRYRLTYGPGPNTPYLQAMACWPSPFTLDPCRLSFRVPYRDYQTAWLLAWVDDSQPEGVPEGNVSFYRQNAGFPVNHPFEIGAEAIRQGRVMPLNLKTPAGKPLYLVKVPLDSNELYGMSDLAGAFVDMELTKPVSVMRSYPDPIYYGCHPVGRPSSIRVAGITLEEVPFGFKLLPGRYGHVFERPEKPSYAVALTNWTDRPLAVEVRLRARGYDGGETGGAQAKLAIPPRGGGVAKLDFDLQKLGWHQVAVEVAAAGVTRGVSQALVLLPPDTRTWGTAANETRFGSSDGGGPGPEGIGVWTPNTHYSPPLNRQEQGAHYTMLRRLGRTPFMSNHTPHRGADDSKWRNPDGSYNQEYIEGFIRAEYADWARFRDPILYYSAEWAVSQAAQHSPWPLYTGQGLRDLTPEERATVERHIKIFTSTGRALRKVLPNVRLGAFYGPPLGTIAYLRAGMPADLVDWIGMDSPQFELMPEISNVGWALGSELWQVQQEIKRLRWPQIPIDWCEGPFYNTQPGALTETEQAESLVRACLVAVANGVEKFTGLDGNTAFGDAGSSFGAEHYGGGYFTRPPLFYPKPAVAAFATMTAMLNRSDVVGPVDTGVPTTLCLALKRTKEATSIFALWRIHGAQEAVLRVRGVARPMLTDSMGNAAPLEARDGKVAIALSALPVWLTGVEKIEGFEFAAPRYDETPAAVTRPLAAFESKNWTYNGAADPRYEKHHFSEFKTADPELRAEFDQGEKGAQVAVALPVEAANRPLATRYGRLVPQKPIEIPGRAEALGVWVKGNASWGRLVYQLRDAKGEVWLSRGTKDDWNCNDPHALGYVSFEGWRYVRFPLPSNYPWDVARNLEFTWWGSYDGERGSGPPAAGAVRDGIVDLPLTLEAIFVSARNEVPVLGRMLTIPERTYALSGLVAEYDDARSATGEAVAANKVRMPLPKWAGPTENPIARLAAEASGAAPAIKAFEEPEQWRDGRNMVIRFDAGEGLSYKLYLSLYADGRGAGLFKANVKPGDTVTGFHPGTPVYLFLTATGADKKESKPSPAFPLTTVDRFGMK